MVKRIHVSTEKNKTKKAQLKSRELCFIWPTKDLSLEDSLSDCSDNCSRDTGEEPGYVEFL